MLDWIYRSDSEKILPYRLLFHKLTDGLKVRNWKLLKWLSKHLNLSCRHIANNKCMYVYLSWKFSSENYVLTHYTTFTLAFRFPQQCHNCIRFIQFFTPLRSQLKVVITQRAWQSSSTRIIAHFIRLAAGNKNR